MHVPALSPQDLGALTARYAEEVRDGRHPVHTDATARWHVRIHADESVDVWLISWMNEQGTELHDHGGSRGAFTVVAGTLTESVWASGGGRTVDLVRSEGHTVVFGEHYVHDVVNTLGPTAISVHAYSPPLSLMHYYDIEGGQLIRRASTWTDDPEAPAPERVAS
jgi:hypothetical protein